MHATPRPLSICPCSPWEKLHQYFQHLALFSQNSINTNKVEHGITTSDQGLDSKNIAIVVKLGSNFLKKMAEHIKDDTVPKEVPSSAQKPLYQDIQRPTTSHEYQWCCRNCSCYCSCNQKQGR
jgi:hypothetical protein